MEPINYRKFFNRDAILAEKARLGFEMGAHAGEGISRGLSARRERKKREGFNAQLGAVMQNKGGGVPELLAQYPEYASHVKDVLGAQAQRAKAQHEA